MKINPRQLSWSVAGLLMVLGCISVQAASRPDEVTFKFLVTDKKSGQPIDGALITLRTEKDNGKGEFYWDYTNKSGTVEMNRVIGVQYVFRVDHKLYYPYPYGGCSGFQVPQYLPVPIYRDEVNVTVTLDPILSKKNP